jgi:hypothetical protein
MSERGPNVYAISRDFWDDPEFSDAAYSDREAWLWLIGAAAWKDLRTRGSTGAPVILRRGEFSFSIRFLGEKWGWSKSAVDRFFAKLEKRDTIRDTSRDGNKVYSIRNYNKFQVVGAPKRDRSRDDGRDASGTAAGHDRDKEETGVTGVTGEIPDRTEITLPLSDPRCGPDEVGAGQVRSKGEGEQPASQKPPAEPPAASKPCHREDGFERFWRQAEPPKHAAKAKARLAWAKTRHVRPSDDELISCHAAYRASVADENARRRQERPPRAAQSLCHPETFLIDRRWEDFAAAAMAVPSPTAVAPDWGDRGRKLAALIGGDAAFAAWFGEAELSEGEPVTITVGKPFQAKWINEHFSAALERVFGGPVRVACREGKGAALAA